MGAGSVAGRGLRLFRTPFRAAHLYLLLRKVQQTGDVSYVRKRFQWVRSVGMREQAVRWKAGSLSAGLLLAGVAGGMACVSLQTDSQSAGNGGSSRVLTGKAAQGDWTTERPGVWRKITVRDLPAPYATPSVDRGPRLVPQPEGAWPQAPAGFVVERFVSGLDNPREIITAPNGDIFIAESQPGRIRVLRPGQNGKPASDTFFASGLRQPFGMAFYPNGSNPHYLYVGNTDSVVRFAYRIGDVKAREQEETIVPNLPSGGRLRGGGHWTRDVRFSRDGKKMFVSVGSVTNDYEKPNAPEARRADVLQFNPDGSGERIYAKGIRNAVGLAIHPETGDLWGSVNERDGLGDDLVPDYITRIRENSFYGWPWFYIGGHQDPRHPGAHPELKGKVTIPDVLVQAHLASLCIMFYTGSQFPQEYRNDAFAAQHGSWNRERRVGYKVIRVPAKQGVPTGEYEDFLTGFVTPEGKVWGRPVGVTMGNGGSLYISDDASGTIWRVVYKGKTARQK
jgi:glucose/arabinose dehydrogenase